MAASPVAQVLNELCGTVPQPSIQLGLFIELLATDLWNDEVPTLDLGEGRHVTPQLFELGDRKHVLLTVTSAAFHVFDRHVGRQPLADLADGGIRLQAGQ